MENNKVNTDNTVLKGCMSLIVNLSFEELRFLLIEINEISSSHIPVKFKQSKIMKKLFQLEKSHTGNYWADQFYNIKRGIEVEVLWRVRKDNLK